MIHCQKVYLKGPNWSLSNPPNPTSPRLVTTLPSTSLWVFANCLSVLKYD